MKRVGACVLAFHRVVETPVRDHDISLESFYTLLDEIEEESVTPNLAKAFDKPSSVVLTFDDGTVDHLQVGQELAARGLRAVFFVSGGLTGEMGHLDEHALCALASQGHELGGHGYSHVSLREVSPERLREEVARSTEALESVTGNRVRYFAPPGGLMDRRVESEIVANGFEACRSMRWGIFRSASEMFAIPCVPVTELTLQRGWVGTAVKETRLPLSMRAAWAAKSALPAGPRMRIRGALHRAAGKRGMRG